MSETAEPLHEVKAHAWKRDALDWYVEPSEASDALFAVERFIGAIWDPACGNGNIVESALKWNYQAFGTDVRMRLNVHWFVTEADFLDWWKVPLAPNVVVNPPFFRAKGAEAFIRKALALATGKVAAFVDIRFLAGADRADGLFAEHPPSRAWILAPRVSCPPGDYLLAGGKAGNGSSDWCWLVWDRTAPPGPTVLNWLRWKALLKI
ncbi:MAG: hypothetical protein P4L76_17905 [Beijerinckiaceae bacterium]|nr:hypothetical protein [Beijerinckiaceae bacterium]